MKTRVRHISGQNVLRLGLFLGCLLCFSFGLRVPSVNATIPPCSTCSTGTCFEADCELAKQIIEEDHRQGEKEIIDFIGESHGGDGVGGSGEFEKHEDWTIKRNRDGTFTEGFAVEHFIRAMMMMTEQLSAVAMQQVMLVGQFFDSKSEMENYRLFQELQAQAHRDYQPSKDFCYFGTNTRSLAHTNRLALLNAQALNSWQKARHLGSAANPTVGVAGSYDRSDDRAARWSQFTSTYCDPADNNYIGGSTGLVLACGGGGTRPNNDVDFTRLVEMPRTLNINFTNRSGTNDEVDVLALSSNLYGHDVLTREVDETSLSKTSLADNGVPFLYMDLRSVAAKRGVAEHSFNTIVGMKSSGTTDEGDVTQFLYAVMKDLGVPDNEIGDILGQNPSYFSQLEILTKKIYQNSTFYADLYDKPANVARKSAALRAIELMLDRAIYESQLRREMMTSVLLSSKLRTPFRAANEQLIAE